MSSSNEQNNPSTKNQEKLSFFEVVVQALALLFAVQNKSGRQRLLDLAESNPLPVLLSGFTASVLFFGFCFGTSQFVLRVLFDL